MHPLSDGSGVIARAIAQNATGIRIEPVYEKEKPGFELQRVGKHSNL
jgi:hypothetical protein